MVKGSLLAFIMIASLFLVRWTAEVRRILPLLYSKAEIEISPIPDLVREFNDTASSTAIQAGENALVCVFVIFTCFVLLRCLQEHRRPG